MVESKVQRKATRSGRTQSGPPGAVHDGVLTPARRRSRQVEVHPTAIVDPQAELGPDVQIGPGSVIGPQVRLGAGVQVGSHVILSGDLVVGRDTRIWHHAVLGEEPQDFGFEGERSSTRIGARCLIRESVTVNRGTGEGTCTVVGDEVLLMANAHVGHNSVIGSNSILGGGALLAGFVQLAPRSFVSGNAVVHQFVRIGHLAIVGGASRVSRDVPPFALLTGDSSVRGLNGVGIRRAGVPRESQTELRRLFHLLYRNGHKLPEAIEAVEREAKTPEGRMLAEFLLAESRRGLCGYHARSERA